LQELLNTTTNHNFAVDGNFGSQTKAALMEFESNNNLDPDGTMDKLTLAILDKKNPNTLEELTELLDLILSIINPHDKGESRVRAESVFDNLMKTMPFNLLTSARMIWKEKFGVNREVLEWWK
jgi:peptidoglycan hydrolase-like protein with peptidoglycan-binding domain